MMSIRRGRPRAGRRKAPTVWSRDTVEAIDTCGNIRMDSEDKYVGPERRESPRYKVSLRARWGGGEWAGRHGTVTNLSADGCFVVADDPVVEGETGAGAGRVV